MKNLVPIAIIVLFAVVAALAAYIINIHYIHPVPQTVTEVKLAYGVPEILLPDTMYFAGERVPLEIPDVRERLDRELHVNAFWHSNMVMLLKRGNRWLPQMEEILQAEGIPADLKYLAVIESDLLNKVSPSEAVGFWQLLKGTAKDFKLEVNDEVDERYHPLKSTKAATIYLRKAHEKFGTWTDAAASYNIGRRGLEQAMIKQGVSSYYDLLLGEETSRYVFRALAVKLIFENPDKYGFYLTKRSLYPEESLKEVDVDATISNLRDWAEDLDTQL
ncbi:MAG: lytic transglycosylase domain-containing protein [Cyclobacteriaceae bacterium]|nr:lytic transglycosylase domain-containing protein [Cyclobacteriaceae bacterium]